MVRTLSVLSLISAGVLANAATLATFNDPAANGSTPLFSVDSSSMSGSWNGTGLNLVLSLTGVTYNDVKMSMASVSRTGNTVGSGSVVFYTNTVNDPIFKVDFSGGTVFEPFGFGASFVSNQGVSFSGSALSGQPPLTNGQFAFSFANPVVNGGTTTYTSAFTSSADPVPEPATLGLLGLAGAALARRRKSV